MNYGNSIWLVVIGYFHGIQCINTALPDIIRLLEEIEN